MVGHESKIKHIYLTNNFPKMIIACLTWLAVTGCKKLSAPLIHSTGFTSLIIKLEADWVCVFEVRLFFVVIGLIACQLFCGFTPLFRYVTSERNMAHWRLAVS